MEKGYKSLREVVTRILNPKEILKRARRIGKRPAPRPLLRGGRRAGICAGQGRSRSKANRGSLHAPVQKDGG